MKYVRLCSCLSEIQIDDVCHRGPYLGDYFKCSRNIMKAFGGRDFMRMICLHIYMFLFLSSKTHVFVATGKARCCQGIERPPQD